MNVPEATESYIEAKRLSGRGLVLGQVARALAGQLDAATEAGTARAMSAVPPLASRLIKAINAIEELSPDERDEIEGMLRPLRRAA